MVEKSNILSALYLFQKIDHIIRQNNTLNIYEKYFRIDDDPIVENTDPLKTVNVIRDPQQIARMVTDVSFSPANPSKIAAAYASCNFGALTLDTNKESYVWDLSK